MTGLAPVWKKWIWFPLSRNILRSVRTGWVVLESLAIKTCCIEAFSTAMLWQCEMRRNDVWIIDLEDSGQARLGQTAHWVVYWAVTQQPQNAVAQTK